MTIHQHIAASIDLGSNTFRLLVADCTAGKLTVLDKKTVTVRLGRSLQNSGLLHDDSMQKGFEVLRTFRESLDHFQPQNIRICGTEALRRARNNEFFLQNAEKILRHKIDILTGEEEAHLSFAGALSGSKEPLCMPLLLVDVGGGSTELLYRDAADAKIRYGSIPVGVVGLTEKFLASPPHHDITSMDELLADMLGNTLKDLTLLAKQSSVLIIGCGGTATSMAALDLKLTFYNESLVHGHVLQYDAIETLWNKLSCLSVEKRNELPGLGEGRGEILPAGIRIYLILLKLLQQDMMRVSDTGLLEGILLSSLPDADALVRSP